jgi:CHAD domain-containing protein
MDQKTKEKILGEMKYLIQLLESSIVHVDLDQLRKTRVALKRISAWIPLTSSGAELKSVARSIQDISHELRDSRDIQVLRKTLQRYPVRTERESRVRLCLSRNLSSRERKELELTQARRGVLRHCLKRLTEFTDQLEKIPSEQIRKKNDRPSERALLKKYWSVSKRAFKRAKRESTGPDWHRWRKKLKRTHYILELCESPQSFPRVFKRTKKLGKLLGKYHDLVILQENLGSITDKKIPLKARLRKDLRRMCGRLEKCGEKLYQSKNPAS